MTKGGQVGYRLEVFANPYTNLSLLEFKNCLPASILLFRYPHKKKSNETNLVTERPFSAAYPINPMPYNCHVRKTKGREEKNMVG